MIEYIKRIGKARGFGIQSPWAYSFVTEVVGERLPFYGYDEIDRQCRSRRERKLMRLYLRIENFIHGHKLYQLTLAEPLTNRKVDATSVEEMIDIVRSANDTKAAIVVEGIDSSKEAHAQWLLLRDAEEVGVTFDLRHIAICFLDRTMYKQHYKLNF